MPRLRPKPCPTLPHDDVGDLMRAIFAPPDWHDWHAARSDERQARAEERARMEAER